MIIFSEKKKFVKGWLKPFWEKSLTLASLVFFMFNYDFNRTMTACTRGQSITYFSNNLQDKTVC